MSIEILDVTKKFGDFSALKNINLKVETGELIALLGPSGSGKTTLLRVIAGLEPADSGRVMIHGSEMTDKKIKDRKVGFVFQHYALFRHMTVFENVAFGLKVRPKSSRPGDMEIKKRVLQLLKLVRLDGMAARYPSQLSGGQRQRVALARSLAIEPSMLLLDEPFGALDANVRKELRAWLRRLHDELHITSVFVTHDVEEALEVADRVVVMNEGKIEQIGRPEEVYHHPINSFVFHFLGSVNLFHGRVDEGKTYLEGKPSDKDSISTKVYVRPHLLEISREKEGVNSFAAQIKYINAAGPFVRIELKSQWGDLVQVEMPHERYHALGLKKEEDVFVVPKEMRVFGPDYSI